MDNSYLYCTNVDTCIHRYGCGRWIGNLSDEEAIEESNNNINGYIDDIDCIQSEPYQFIMLDRFRNSNER